MVLSFGIVCLIGSWLGDWRGNSAEKELSGDHKKAEMPLITRLNYPVKDEEEADEKETWNVAMEDRSKVVRRRPEVRAVLLNRPEASEEMGGMPAALREKLEVSDLESLADLLPLYQQWGVRNGPDAAVDALRRKDFFNSDKPLVAVFHGWMLVDKHGPEIWLRGNPVKEMDTEAIMSALKTARGW